MDRVGLGVLIAAFAVTFVVARRRILRRVRGELGQNALLLAAVARVGGYNGSAEGRRPSLAIGILMLLSSGLYFHSWTGRREVFIPGPSISWIGVSEGREGSRVEGHRIVVRFLDASGNRMALPSDCCIPSSGWMRSRPTSSPARRQGRRGRARAHGSATLSAGLEERKGMCRAARSDGS